jgi:hypothetical protein
MSTVVIIALSIQVISLVCMLGASVTMLKKSISFQ